MTRETLMLADLGQRILRARLRQNQTQAQLADAAGVSLSTIRRLESGGGSQLSAFLGVLRALDLLDELDAAIPSGRPSPIELADTNAKPRKRASGKRSEPKAEQPFQWGDESP